MNRISGAVAQLGEHYLRKVGVGGSNPLCSRNLSMWTNFWLTVYRKQKTAKIVVFSFENLKVYKDPLAFTKVIYKLTKQFSKDEIFGLTSQLRRAVSSVALNIAEESGLTQNEFQNF